MPKKAHPPYSPLAVLVGHNVAEARELSDVTQEALAKAAKVTPLYISAIERGRRLPSLETLIAIAETLAVTLDRLTGRK